MRFILQLIAIIVTAFLLELFLPWWIIAVVSFILGYVLKSNLNFLAGFLGIGLLWFFKALIIANSSANNLHEKISSLFQLNNGFYLVLVTALVGGLVGGFAALTGSLLKEKKKRNYYYYK